MTPYAVETIGLGKTFRKKKNLRQILRRPFLPGEPTAKAALRLAEHLLRQDKRDEARGFFARVLAETADPWWRVEAAEGLARATGVTAEQFVRSELPKIQSASRSQEAR